MTAKATTTTKTLRPERLCDYAGQDHIKASLQQAINGAKSRKDTLDHALFYGPPGLGKTTLASIIAHEMGGNFISTSSSALQQPAQIIGILRQAKNNSIIFIDEIHRLPAKVEEVLYPAMEDGFLDFAVGDGAYRRSLRIQLPTFTLVGATTHLSRVSQPLRERFGLVYRLDYYSQGELSAIVVRTAGILGATVTPAAADALAARSQGVARIANRLLRRVRDYSSSIDVPQVEACMADLGIDELGLDATDRAILLALRDRYNGGPVGLVSLATATGEDEDTVQDVYEPYLMRLDFLNRTPRGRILTPAGAEYLMSADK